jgi:hypothetical protein
MAEIEVDFSRLSISVRILPESRWDPPELVISDGNDEVRMKLTDEDLKEINEKIRRHLMRKIQTSA